VNFKRPAYCSCFDVEGTDHVTLTVHQTFKMASVVDDLFVIGDDFEAILDLLEQDDDLEQEFSIAASEVSRLNLLFVIYYRLNEV